jgi:S-adenosylmethionine decarboxylase
MNALTPLGMVSVIPSENQANLDADRASRAIVPEPSKDYFVERDGETFAGMHLLVDVWEARDITDPARIDAALRRAALAAGATILHAHFHHFSPNGGVSGVLVLAESHISIHTWPERDFAAIDIFMCGACDPYLSVPVIREAFQSENVDLTEKRRGRIA